jgi:hypothetical protein
MKRRFVFSALLFVLVFASGVLQCQQLTVQTDSGKQVVRSRADLEALPHVKVTASEHSSAPSRSLPGSCEGTGEFGAALGNWIAPHLRDRGWASQELVFQTRIGGALAGAKTHPPGPFAIRTGTRVRPTAAPYE